MTTSTRSSATGGVLHVAASTTGGIRTESWSYRTVRTATKQRSLRVHAPPHGVCDNLLKALQLLANQQLGGDSLAEVLGKGLQERSRLKMMEGLGRFITVDNHVAVQVGDLENPGTALGGEAPIYCGLPRSGGAYRSG